MLGHLSRKRVVLRHVVQMPTFVLAPTLHVETRFFSSRRNLNQKKDNPFKTLGITESTPYGVAKKRFLKIAMENHPDTSVVENDKDRDRLRDIFITARRAFEQLVEAPDGSILLKDEAAFMPDFDDWFKQETGHKNPFDVNLDPQTVKEVAAMTEEVGGGLDRDGGMWQLAKSITAAHNAGGDASAILRLEGGEINYKNRRIDGELRRRRR
jgi:hypothetical protein